MAEKNFVCPTKLANPLTVSQISSHYSPASALKDGDSVVQLSDIDPQHSYLPLLLDHYSQFFDDNPSGIIDENAKFRILDLDQQARAHLAKKLWTNLQELRQKIDPSSSQSQFPFTKLPRDASSQLLRSLWNLLECQYPNDLLKIFPEKKLGGVAVVAGDSSVTQELNELLKSAGYTNEIGFIDVEKIDPSTPGFYSRMVFASMFGLNLVKIHPEAEVFVHRFLDVTLDDRFLKPRSLNPFGAKLFSSRAADFIAPPLIEEYARGKSHLDYLMEEFRVRKKRQNPDKNLESAPLFQIRLGANNSMASMFTGRPIDFSQIRSHAEELDKKTKQLLREYPGTLRVFTLPPHVPHLLLSEIHPEDQFYNEDGKPITEGYTVRSWFEEKEIRPKKVVIPQNAVFSKSTYERLEREATELNKTLQQTLEPLGWTLLDASNETLDQILAEGLSIHSLEGFGDIHLKGMGDFLISDGFHPKPITALKIALRETWELGQHGVAIDFHRSNPDQSVDAIVLDKLNSLVALNPSRWLSDVRMPMQKVIRLKAELSKVDSLETLQNLLSPYWVYFERENLVKFLKEMDPNFKTTRFEEVAVAHYLKLGTKEKISSVEGALLQRHQLAHLIQSRMKDARQSTSAETVSRLIKIVEAQLKQKEKDHSKTMGYSKYVLKGVGESPKGFSKYFYAGARAEVSSGVSIAAPIGSSFSAGIGAEVGTHSIEKGGFIFLPAAASIWGHFQLLGSLPQPVAFQFSLRLHSCQYLSALRLSLCEGGEISNLLSLQRNIDRNSIGMRNILEVGPFMEAAFHPTHSRSRFFLKPSYGVLDGKFAVDLGFRR